MGVSELTISPSAGPFKITSKVAYSAVVQTGSQPAVKRTIEIKTKSSANVFLDIESSIFVRLGQDELWDTAETYFCNISLDAVFVVIIIKTNKEIPNK